MLQLNLLQYCLEDYLPDEVIELQYQWIKAIEYRMTYETTPDYYELMDGLLEPVFLSEEYHIARRLEMDCFDRLCDYGNIFPVFQGVNKYLYL